ncbi:MAG: hypothetical protein RL376_1209 [Verrucomicrobiota bacterium]|jgi:hypothetical protein
MGGKGDGVGAGASGKGGGGVRKGADVAPVPIGGSVGMGISGVPPRSPSSTKGSGSSGSWTGGGGGGLVPTRSLKPVCGAGSGLGGAVTEGDEGVGGLSAGGAGTAGFVPAGAGAGSLFKDREGRRRSGGLLLAPASPEAGSVGVGAGVGTAGAVGRFRRRGETSGEGSSLMFWIS